MKTIIVYSDFQDLPKYFIREGVLQYLDKTIINESEANEANIEELTNLLFNEDGSWITEPLKDFPVDLEGEWIVITCGFYQ